MPPTPRPAFVIKEKGANFSARANSATHQGSTIHLRGDVEIVAGSARITADEADLHPGRDAEVRGNVRVGVVRRWWHRSSRTATD
jgi:lipopolysaccharide assembly outer membrane protein LptD (OstA)